jgi:hypothetical protein
VPDGKLSEWEFEQERTKAFQRLLDAPVWGREPPRLPRGHADFDIHCQS